MKDSRMRDEDGFLTEHDPEPRFPRNPPEEDDVSEPWRVLRHGGRRTDKWRTVFRGDEPDARAAFDSCVRTMRQGEVQLLDPINTLVERQWAPCLRSRW